MADFMRLARQGLRAYRMYQRVSRTLRGRRDAGRAPLPRDASGHARRDRDAAPTAPGTTTSPAGTSRPYPGDWMGPVTPHYDPHPDGRPDPGEVVWTWVPYEEDHSRGKDRPVLIVDRAGEYLLCVMLTSKDHDTAAHDDPDFVDVGTGDWDRSGRPSEARIDRIIPVRPEDVRREGAVLARSRFDAVAAEVTTRTRR